MILSANLTHCCSRQTFFLQILQYLVKMVPAASRNSEYALAGVGGTMGLGFSAGGARSAKPRLGSRGTGFGAGTAGGANPVSRVSNGSGSVQI